MLRTATKGSATRGNVALDRVISSRPTDFSLKAFSTWLASHHLPQNTSNAVQESLRSSLAPSSSRITSSGNRFASTRSSRLSDPPASEVAQLPRYLRRQHLSQKSATAEYSPRHTAKKNVERSFERNGSRSVGTQSSSLAKSTTFRSRHFDGSKDTPKSELRLLEPHVLSGRLKKLCEAGKVDDAVSMLKNAPSDAQNTPVWNTLIWESLKAKRYQLAYQLFIDMKRRGFSPTIRTFQTFFGGLARIDEWSTHPKQLANARSLYESYQRLVASMKKADPHDPELSVDALGGYIRILGKAGQYQEIFDVYYAMEQEGPLAPTKYIFTAMFQAVSAAKNDTVEGSVKVAADARLLWNQLIKAARKNPDLAPDSHTVVSALTALSGGNQMDYDLGFKIIEEYFGLETDKKSSLPGKLPLGPEALNAILQFCNRTKNYPHCAQFLQQVKRRPEHSGGVSILDRVHMEEVLKADLILREPGIAYHALDTLEWMLRQEITGRNGPNIRPGVQTYNLVMQACWRGADWNSAVRAFELMTGYHGHDFKDGSVAAVPRFDKRGPGRNLPPNAEIMSSMMKSALATRNRADMRQALRIVDYLGFQDLLLSGSHEQYETMKLMKHRALFGKKLAEAILDTTDQVLADGGKYARPEEVKKWTALRQEAEKCIKDDGPFKSVEQSKPSRVSKESNSTPHKRHLSNTN